MIFQKAVKELLILDLALQLFNMLKQVGSKDLTVMILPDKNLFHIAV